VLKSSKCKLAWFCTSCKQKLEEWKADRNKGKEKYVETITKELEKRKKKQEGTKKD
jgi:hypothetical protein